MKTYELSIAKPSIFQILILNIYKIKLCNNNIKYYQISIDPLNE